MKQRALSSKLLVEFRKLSRNEIRNVARSRGGMGWNKYFLFHHQSMARENRVLFIDEAMIHEWKRIKSSWKGESRKKKNLKAELNKTNLGKSHNTNNNSRAQQIDVLLSIFLNPPSFCCCYASL